MQLSPVNMANSQPLKPVIPANFGQDKVAFKNSDANQPVNFESFPTNIDSLQKEMQYRIKAYTELKFAELSKNGSCVI